MQVRTQRKQAAKNFIDLFFNLLSFSVVSGATWTTATCWTASRSAAVTLPHPGPACGTTWQTAEPTTTTSTSLRSWTCTAAAAGRRWLTTTWAWWTQPDPACYRSSWFRWGDSAGVVCWIRQGHIVPSMTHLICVKFGENLSRFLLNLEIKIGTALSNENTNKTETLKCRFSSWRPHFHDDWQTKTTSLIKHALSSLWKITGKHTSASSTADHTQSILQTGTETDSPFLFQISFTSPVWVMWKIITSSFLLILTDV